MAEQRAKRLAEEQAWRDGMRRVEEAAELEATREAPMSSARRTDTDTRTEPEASGALPIYRWFDSRARAEEDSDVTVPAET